MTEAILGTNVTTNTQVLYMAMELSSSKWKLGFSKGTGNRVREVNVVAGDLDGLQAAVSRARKKFKIPDNARVVSCYEAGRDGFWIHRYLESVGIENKVVDSSSIEVKRRSRRRPSDICWTCT